MNRPSSMVCPGCGNLISTEETACPICGAKHPNLFGLGPYLTRLFGQQIDILSLIPTACIALYVLSLVLDLGAALTTRGGIFGMLSPGRRPLILLGMTGGGLPWWTNLTAIYLHGSLLHILFNFMWIRQLGPEVGHLYGPARFFIIFTAGGVFGFVLSNLISGAPTIGASGAIFGLLAALIVYGRNHQGSVAAMMTRQVWQWAILMFIFGFMMSGVNNIAHLGGFIGGWIASQALVGGAAYKETRPVILFALGLLVLTGGTFTMSLINYWPVLFLR
ncbi:TPA: rhomboid family intramembrane serine protease [Candidatus Latescibacteria bacterium]|nr:rhomboid family intramembrane serine protease [Candidatus Latescibacterota bacterium]